MPHEPFVRSVGPTARWPFHTSAIDHAYAHRVPSNLHRLCRTAGRLNVEPFSGCDEECWLLVPCGTLDVVTQMNRSTGSPCSPRMNEAASIRFFPSACNSSASIVPLPQWMMNRSSIHSTRPAWPLPVFATTRVLSILKCCSGRSPMINLDHAPGHGLSPRM